MNVLKLFMNNWAIVLEGLNDSLERLVMFFYRNQTILHSPLPLTSHQTTPTEAANLYDQTSLMILLFVDGDYLQLLALVDGSLDVLTPALYLATADIIALHSLNFQLSYL